VTQCGGNSSIHTRVASDQRVHEPSKRIPSRFIKPIGKGGRECKKTCHAWMSGRGGLREGGVGRRGRSSLDKEAIDGGLNNKGGVHAELLGEKNKPSPRWEKQLGWMRDKHGLSSKKKQKDQEQRVLGYFRKGTLGPMWKRGDNLWEQGRN